QSGDRHGGGVPRVAGRAAADGAVVVGPADAVALDAAGRDRCLPLEANQRVRRALAGAGVILLGEGHLFGRKALLAVDGRPGRGTVPAPQELLVLHLVAAAAVGRGQPLADDEAVVVELFLSLRWLVAVETGDPLPGRGAKLVLVDDRMLLLRVALGTLSRRADVGRAGLVSFDAGPMPVDQEAGEDQPEADDEGNEDGAKRHACNPPRQRTLRCRNSRKTLPA